MPCDAPVASSVLVSDYTAVEVGLRDGDDATVTSTAARLEAEAPCLDSVMPTAALYAHVYRAIAAGKVLSGDAAGGAAWFGSSLSVEPMFAYGLEDLPADAKVRVAYEDRVRAGIAQPASASGTFAPETVMLDGRKIKAPAATPDVPHLVQAVAADGTVTTWQIDGAAFPPELMVAEGPIADVKHEKTEKVDEHYGREGYTDADGVWHPPRKTPPEKYPLIIGGGLLAIGAGGLYAASASAHQDFEDSATIEEVTATRKRTNALFTASVATLAVGASTASWGVIVADGGVLPAVNVRW
jgi:hypothetical protein